MKNTYNELISNFKQSDLKFKYIENEFTHNYNRDIQFIILWENGRDKETEVINEIKKKYNILYCTNVKWSDKHNRNNFNRLYTQKLNSKDNLNKHKKIGMGEFLCIVFEDPNPKYNYLQSLSGDVFIGNANVVDTKYNLRKLLGGNLVHSTSGISEFFHHASLLFHSEKLKDVLEIKNWDEKTHHLEQDLAGAEGWKSFEELIKIANYSSDWVVLRNHEYLPNDFWENDKDIDLLCKDLNLFSTAVNAKKRKGNISAYETVIEGKVVPLDIRFIGDNYYDPVWQSKMIERKTFHNSIVPCLRNDDYFFSLLYHSKLQKPSVKEVYIPRLIKTAKSIGIDDVDKDFILNDEKTGKMINGFLKEQGYYFYQPNDENVFLNRKVSGFITTKPIKGKIELKTKTIKNLAKITPSFIKKAFPETLKNKLKN